MPLLAIPVDDLADQMLAKRIGDDDFTNLVDAGHHGWVTVGGIMRVARLSGPTALFFTIIGPAAPDSGWGLAGEAESLEDAKAAFRATFGRLLRYAAVTDGELSWHVGAARVMTDK